MVWVITTVDACSRDIATSRIRPTRQHQLTAPIEHDARETNQHPSTHSNVSHYRRQGCRPRKQASGLSKGTAVSFEARAIACHVCIPLPRYLYMYLRGWRYYCAGIMQSWYGRFQSSAVLKLACVPGAGRWQPNRSVSLWRTTCCGPEIMTWHLWPLDAAENGHGHDLDGTPLSPADNHEQEADNHEQDQTKPPIQRE